MLSNVITRRSRGLRIVPLMALGVAIGLSATPVLAGWDRGERTIRVSRTGVDGDAARDTVDPSVAYNPHLGEYLVTWSADGLRTDDEFEIFAQRLGPFGTLRGPRIRVSTTGVDGDASRATFSPAVAYNMATRQYLVTWRADGLATDEEYEVFAQRLGALGDLRAETSACRRRGSTAMPAETPSHPTSPPILTMASSSSPGRPTRSLPTRTSRSSPSEWMHAAS